MVDESIAKVFLVDVILKIVTLKNNGKKLRLRLKKEIIKLKTWV